MPQTAAFCKMTTYNLFFKSICTHQKKFFRSGIQLICLFSQSAISVVLRGDVHGLFTSSTSAYKCFEVSGALWFFVARALLCLLKGHVNSPSMGVLLAIVDWNTEFAVVSLCHVRHVSTDHTGMVEAGFSTVCKMLFYKPSLGRGTK